MEAQSQATNESLHPQPTLEQRKLAVIQQVLAIQDVAELEAVEQAVVPEWMRDPYLLEQLRESMEDVKAGRTVPAEVVFEQMYAKLAKRRAA